MFCFSSAILNFSYPFTNLRLDFFHNIAAVNLSSRGELKSQYLVEKGIKCRFSYDWNTIS